MADDKICTWEDVHTMTSLDDTGHTMPYVDDTGHTMTYVDDTEQLASDMCYT